MLAVLLPRTKENFGIEVFSNCRRIRSCVTDQTDWENTWHLKMHFFYINFYYIYFFFLEYLDHDSVKLCYSRSQFVFSFILCRVYSWDELRGSSVTTVGFMQLIIRCCILLRTRCEFVLLDELRNNNVDHWMVKKQTFLAYCFPIYFNPVY